VPRKAVNIEFKKKYDPLLYASPKKFHKLICRRLPSVCFCATLLLALYFLYFNQISSHLQTQCIAANVQATY